MNAIQFHIQGFRLYLLRLDENEINQAGLAKLEQIDKLVEELREDFKTHPDKRSNVIRDTDVQRKS